MCDRLAPFHHPIQQPDSKMVRLPAYPALISFLRRASGAWGEPPAALAGP